MSKLQCCKCALIVILLGLLDSNTCWALEDPKPANKVEAKLTEMKLKLPKLYTPSANYVPYTIVGKLVFISGNIPMDEGKVQFVGKLGANVSDADGIKAARLCALNIIAQLKDAVGSLDKVKRCVKLTGFVNATPEFTSTPQIINGASDLIVSIFGNKGKHARAAIGVATLPFGAAVEIDAIFEME